MDPVQRSVSVEVIVHHSVSNNRLQLDQVKSEPCCHDDDQHTTNQDARSDHVFESEPPDSTAADDGRGDTTTTTTTTSIVLAEEGAAAIDRDECSCHGDECSCHGDVYDERQQHEELLRRFNEKYWLRLQGDTAAGRSRRDFIESIINPDHPQYNEPMSAHLWMAGDRPPQRQNSGTQTDNSISWPYLDPIDRIYMESMNLTPIQHPAADDEDSVEEATAALDLPFQSMVLLCECLLCVSNVGLYLRPCCYAAVCRHCLQQYFMARIDTGDCKMECPCCESFVHVDEVRALLLGHTKYHNIFNRKLVEANLDPGAKTCPRCSHVYHHQTTEGAKSKTQSNKVLNTLWRKYIRKSPRGRERGTREVTTPSYKIECPVCALVWCYNCHAPWHTDTTCREYQRGDKAVKIWSKKFTGDPIHGLKNAQKCPKCKAFIQKISGCDHMHCRFCETEFCYRCGGRYINTRLIGRHSSKFSVLGCKYTYQPNRPVVRRLVRGSILAGTLLSIPFISAGAFVAGGVVVTMAAIILPFYATVKLSRRLNRYRKERRTRTPTCTLYTRTPKVVSNVDNDFDRRDFYIGTSLAQDIATHVGTRPPLRFSISLDTGTIATPSVVVVDSNLRLTRSASAIVRIR